MQTHYKILFFSSLTALAIFYFLPAEPLSAPKNALPRKPELQAPDIEAKSAMAQNLLTGKVLFSKNPKEIRPLASLTKIITLLAIFDRMAFNEEILISQDAILTPEPSSLRIGERLRAKDLAAMVMVESSNDAIFALFEHTYQKNQDLFLNIMRVRAQTLGAISMNFNNITGLDETESVAGGYGSAEDMLAVAKAALTSELWQLGAVREVVSKEEIRHLLRPTNDLYKDLPNLIGAKTGFTDLAGGNLLVIIEYPLGHPLGIVVLGSSEKGRFSDIKKILEWIKLR